MRPPTCTPGARYRCVKPSRSSATKPKTSVRTVAVGPASAISRLTLWKPQIACSAGTSAALHPGALSAPLTPASASRVPSRSLNASVVSPKRFAGGSWATPFSTSRWAQKPIEPSGMLNTVSWASPIPSLPGGAPSQGKKSEDRARMAGFVAVIEVIGAGIVEIDRFLHQSQTERSGIEIEVAARRPCNAGHMMDAAQHTLLRFGGIRSGV